MSVGRTNWSSIFPPVLGAVLASSLNCRSREPSPLFAVLAVAQKANDGELAQFIVETSQRAQVVFRGPSPEGDTFVVLFQEMEQRLHTDGGLQNHPVFAPLVEAVAQLPAETLEITTVAKAICEMDVTKQSVPQVNPFVAMKQGR